MGKNNYSGGNYGANPYQFNNGGYFSNYQYPYNNYPQFQGSPMQQGQQPFTNQYNTQYNTQYQQSSQSQQNFQQAPPTSPTFLAYVNGVEGAKAYIMPPNSCGMLVDCDNPMIYIKTSNQQSQSGIKYLKLVEVDDIQTASLQQVQSVSREEFENVKQELDKLRQYIQPNEHSRMEVSDNDSL